jgi:hypothetical protein
MFVVRSYHAVNRIKRDGRTAMDMQTPDHTPSPTTATGPLSPSFAARMLNALAATMPGASADDADARSETWCTACELFHSLDPQDPADAQLAAIAVAAAQSAMDNFARAARPDVSNETVLRLRSSALAAGRTYAATLRNLRKRPAAKEETGPAAPPAPAPKVPEANPSPKLQPGFVALRPGAEPIPAVEMFQPRDRLGRPIPGGRVDLMTRAQVLASLAWPRDPKLEAAAIAEEAAMMAEQAALEARGTAAKIDTG